MSKRLPISLNKKHAMEVTRVSIGKKPLKYQYDRSRIAYIGTTKKGVGRIAQSAAARAEAILGLRGVRDFIVRVLTCPPRPKVKTWVKLERALLFVFRQRYGALPKCNIQGKNMKERDEFKYFRRDRLERVLEKLA